MIKEKENKLAAIILAAGKGTRMKSDLAKVLHPLCGKPMVWYVVDLARNVGAEKTVVVVGHQASKVMETVSGQDIVYALQKEQLGSAHAVLQASDALSSFEGDVLILCGDVPLLLSSTIASLLDNHRSAGKPITVMTTILENPGSYGRVVKNEEGDVLKIVEARDASSKEMEIKEINTGIYCASNKFLFDAVRKIGNTNSQNEYYFTDIFEIALKKGQRAGAFILDNPSEAMGINTVEDLKGAENLFKIRHESST